MANKQDEFSQAKSDLRERNGWTLEEIKANARREYKLFKNIAKEEPKELVSGDMDSIINGENDER